MFSHVCVFGAYHPACIFFLHNCVCMCAIIWVPSWEYNLFIEIVTHHEFMHVFKCKRMCTCHKCVNTCMYTVTIILLHNSITMPSNCYNHCYNNITQLNCYCNISLIHGNKSYCQHNNTACYGGLCTMSR